MDFDAITLRDLVLVTVGLAAIYLVVMVLRLTLVSRRKRAAAEETRRAPTLDETAEDAAPQDEAEDEVEAEPVYSRPAQRAEPQPATDFGAELARSQQARTQQDAEARQLRKEMAQMRDETDRLREEIVQLKKELDDLKAARFVSPQYSDAVAFAQRGLSAQDVADRCGISLGEAELIWALAKGPANFDQEEDYGGEPGVEQHARSA